MKRKNEIAAECQYNKGNQQRNMLSDLGMGASRARRNTFSEEGMCELRPKTEPRVEL